MSIRQWTFALLASQGICQLADAFPNQSYDESEVGKLLSHNAPEMGRLAVIEVLGDYVITIPEGPSSPEGSDLDMRAWDISDPENPVEVQNFGDTRHPFLAHGTIKQGNELSIFGSHWENALSLDSSNTLSISEWSGLPVYPNKSGMMSPWAARDWWSYGEVSGDGWIRLKDDLSETNDVITTWDHLGLTGVIGFANFMGNIMIYASDQTMSGVAAYDISDPSNPRLLDRFNKPEYHPEITTWDNTPMQYGVGGYWSEISGHYMVFARGFNNPGIQVVDFSDPTNLRLHCEYLSLSPDANLPDGMGAPGGSYLNFQDNWVFSGEIKMNIETCEVALLLDERGTLDGGVGHYVDTDQYSRPIGNLVLTGGLGSSWDWPDGTNGAGMGIWVHDANPDTTPPYVAYHVPEANATGYPITHPLSFSIPETLDARTIIPGETLLLVNVATGANVPVNYVLTHAGILTVDPVGNLEASTLYEVTLENIEDAVGNKMPAYRFRFSTGDPAAQLNQAPIINEIVLPQGDVVINQSASFAILASDAETSNLEYRFRFAGDEYSAWSSSNSFSKNFATIGNQVLTVQVRDAEGVITASAATIQVLQSTRRVTQGLTSSQITYDSVGEYAWVVNPDNDKVSQIHKDSWGRVSEFEVGDDPRSITIDQNGNLWVTAFGDDKVEIYDTSGTLLNSVDLSYGDAPFGIVMNPQSDEAYVSLYGSGELVRISTLTQTETGRISLGYTARALAVSADGSNLLVTKFISDKNWGELWQVDLLNWQLSATIPLYKNLDNDARDNGRGVPNYLSSVIIHEDGARAYVVGKKDNIDRGLLNGSLDLDDDNTVRAMAMTIDVSNGIELMDQRFDFDNTDSPSALAFSPAANYLLVAMQGRNQVLAVSLSEDLRLQQVKAQFPVGHAPQALYQASDSGYLYVKNFTDRTVTLISLEHFFSRGNLNPRISTKSTTYWEVLDSNVLAGKRIFYDASNGVLEGQEFLGRMSAEGYISCATCHADGGQDGQTYDFTGRGEGLRNNISLKGRSGTRFGNVHWSGNFDEIHDFENDIRNAFSGRGFMSDEDFTSTANPLGAEKAGLSEDLDNLAAYVNSLGQESLPKSPWRENDGALSENAIQGQVVFTQLGCHGCHRDAAFTDGITHDVGTIRSYSGSRLGAPLEGIKTPSLLGLFDTAPYLHDGSAARLEDVFISAGGEVIQSENLNYSGALVSQSNYSYLRGGAGVRLAESDNISFSKTVNQTGEGMLAIRYGSVNASANLVVDVNGVQTIFPLAILPTIQGEDVNFTEKKLVVSLSAGLNNIDVSLQASSTGASVIVDDITLSTPEEFSNAFAHTQVVGLTEYDQQALLAYLKSLDGSDAPADEDLLRLGVIPTPNIVFTQSEQLGSPGQPSSINYDTFNDTYVIESHGGRISGGNDDLPFNYELMSGDFDLRARVFEIEGEGAAGIMIRSSLNENSMMAASMLDGGAVFLHREITGSSVSSSRAENVPLGSWVRLEKVGDTIYSYYSIDNQTWELVGQVDMAFDQTFYVGLTVSGYWGASYNSATISNLHVIYNLPPTITIDNPSTAVSFVELGQRLSFNVTATDALEPDIHNRVIWMSNIDGELGTGAVLDVSDLSVGLHVITAQVTDNRGLMDTDNTLVIVQESQAFNVENVIDLGSYNQDGTLSYASANDIYTMSTDATGINGWIDNATFAYQQFSGDVDLKVKVNSLSDRWEARAGLIIRDNLEVTSKMAAVMLRNDAGAVFQRRLVKGEDSTYANVENLDVGSWLRLRKQGTLLTAYSSPDGESWTTIGTENLDFERRFYIGLVTSSNGNEGQVSATFEGLSYADNRAPLISLNSPKYLVHEQSEMLALSAVAYDREDGNLSAILSWSSNIDGNLGVGAELNIANLSVGVHTISVAVADSHGISTQARMTVVVDNYRVLAQSINIGSASSQGSTQFDAASNSYLLNSVGAGNGFGGWVDHFHFAYREMFGDVDLRVRVANLDSAWRNTTGLVIRESLEYTSKMATTLYVSDVGAEFRRRYQGGTAAVADSAGFELGQWLRLSKVGDVVTSYISSDGDNWTVIGSDTIEFGSSFYVGLGLNGSPDHGFESANSHLQQFSILSLNSAPTISIDQTNLQGITSLDSVVLSGIAHDDLDGDVREQLVWESDIDGVLGTGSMLEVSLSAGIHIITARVNDSFNANSVAQVSVPVQDIIFANFANFVDVGSAPMAGSYHADQHMHTHNLAASGTGIKGWVDDFGFAYQQYSGDFDLRARVLILNGADRAQAGLVLRETLDNSSAMGAIMLKQDGGATFIDRQTPYAGASSQQENESIIGDWVRLEKIGNTVNSYVSVDGEEWHLVGGATITLPENFYIGLFTASDSSHAYTSASFDEVIFVN